MNYYYVYILKCADNSYYTGVTNNLEKRFAEHQSGEDPKSYVFNRRPLKIVWYESYNDINQAILKEKQIKGWSRKQKEALINEAYDALIELSKNSIIRQSFDNPKRTLRQAQGDTLARKFVITGPESAGKTTLASLLAKQYQTIWVKEYAREYLENLTREYSLDDVLLMAKEQLRQEQEAIKNNKGLIFLDTDLTVFFIWIKERYNLEIDWIKDHLKNATNKIYLLCASDIEWQPDPLREHPNLSDRLRLFEEYKLLLEKYQLTYHIISGDIATRLKKCEEILSKCQFE